MVIWDKTITMADKLREYDKETLKRFGNKIEYGRCAGYVIPLFLGGNDDITNLEDSDMEVYWNIMMQILK